MSFNAAALQLMLDKGLSLADVVEIAGANERRADPTATERKRRQRAKEKAERDMSRRDVTRDPSPNERDNLTPTREKNPSNKLEGQKVSRGTRLSADWKPQPLTGKALAMVAAWQPGAMERELAKFKNYWLSKGANAARTDWQRTWVNWLISADEKQPRQSNERSFEQLFAERFGSDDAGDDAPHERSNQTLDQLITARFGAGAGSGENPELGRAGFDEPGRAAGMGFLGG